LLAAGRLLRSCGSRLRDLRSDSAGYTAGVINVCNERGGTFTIPADHDAAVVRLIRSAQKQGGWTRLVRPDGKPTERWHHTTIDYMEKTEKSFALRILRWTNPRQVRCYSEPYCYHVIAAFDDNRKVP
jgi:hypothetical protein